MSNGTFSAKFVRAIEFVNELHSDQTRKGGKIPYLGHLLGVASLVIEDGGSEDEVIAALLHDGPEDQGGEMILVEIEEKFGANVARIVKDCSDTFETPKPAWKERKQTHIAHLKDVGEATSRVVLADKLYNARAILMDLHREGDSTWEKFKGGREGTLWYYGEMHTLLSGKLPGALVDQLGRTIEEIRKVSS